ncbi:hypothetical protein MPTK1_7g02890 [Marchantia polymorpha subsp. ruderalis]|uniref:Uncharacterized protein n=2 Tax=Marchantia polymorpha TaxID=3197 RepID=A0AAF6BVJ1_MARPO|nr:hypothetical protein MARPO_0235s0001 [Marchantia polymorpha]BBN16021.1 hypothetical protein Mp_7g02890 [Marchantia polymorpha subsp. ruderalis]PTQ27043.1 hypothetical protein MARPO_0235s0001 [Marchantia polymorpha]PTQ27044.1 hypothetical protein MARPO_0235s0001 [Marchantia polymorpha]PTQ27045.1 hypothetical protein MARPO_0235s0001 [Marchantia polymorpha]|eukprot:PTQ27042.1 hypothetical protein MARPO_0235s0001 [Marchantia polymorpha]
MDNSDVIDNSAHEAEDQDTEEEDSDDEAPEAGPRNADAGDGVGPRIYLRKVTERTDHNLPYLGGENFLGAPTIELFFDEEGHPYREGARTGPEYDNEAFIERDALGRLGRGIISGSGQSRDRYGRFIDKVGSSYNRRRMRDELRRLNKPPARYPTKANGITPLQDLANLKLAFMDIYLPPHIDPVAEYERIMAGGEVRNYGPVRTQRPSKLRRTGNRNHMRGPPAARSPPRGDNIDSESGPSSDDEEDFGRRPLRPRRLDPRRAQLPPVIVPPPPRNQSPRRDNPVPAARRRRRTRRPRLVLPASPSPSPSPSPSWDPRDSGGADQTARDEALNADEVRRALEAVFGPASEDGDDRDSAAPAPEPLIPHARVAQSNLHTSGPPEQTATDARIGPLISPRQRPGTPTQIVPVPSYRRVQFGGVTVTVLEPPGGNDIAPSDSQARGAPRSPTPTPGGQARENARNSRTTVSTSEDYALRRLKMGDVTVTILGSSEPIQYTEGESLAQGNLQDVRSMTIPPNIHSRRHVEQQANRRQRSSESEGESRQGRSVRQRTASPHVERDHEGEPIDGHRAQWDQQERDPEPARPSYWSSPGSQYADPDLTETIQEMKRINFGEGIRILGESDPDFAPERGDIIVHKKENAQHHMLEYYDPDEFTGLFHAGDKLVRITYSSVFRGGRWLLRVYAELHVCTGHQGTPEATWVYIGRAVHLMPRMPVDDP